MAGLDSVSVASTALKNIISSAEKAESPEERAKGLSAGLRYVDSLKSSAPGVSSGQTYTATELEQKWEAAKTAVINLSPAELQHDLYQRMKSAPSDIVPFLNHAHAQLGRESVQEEVEKLEKLIAVRESVNALKDSKNSAGKDNYDSVLLQKLSDDKSKDAEVFHPNFDPLTVGDIRDAVSEQKNVDDQAKKITNKNKVDEFRHFVKVLQAGGLKNIEDNENNVLNQYLHNKELPPETEPTVERLRGALNFQKSQLKAADTTPAMLSDSSSPSGLTTTTGTEVEEDEKQDEGEIDTNTKNTHNGTGSPANSTTPTVSTKDSWIARNPNYTAFALAAVTLSTLGGPLFMYLYERNQQKKQAEQFATALAQLQSGGSGGYGMNGPGGPGGGPPPIVAGGPGQ